MRPTDEENDDEVVILQDANKDVHPTIKSSSIEHVDCTSNISACTPRRSCSIKENY